MTDETVDGDVRWADLSEWLRDRALVLRLVLCRGIFLAELTPESDARMWASSGGMPSEAIARARRKVLDEGGDHALAVWERSVLQAVAARGGDAAALGWPPGASQVEAPDAPVIEFALERRPAAERGEPPGAWELHGELHASAEAAYAALDEVPGDDRAWRDWQVRAVRAEVRS